MRAALLAFLSEAKQVATVRRLHRRIHAAIDHRVSGAACRTYNRAMPP